MKVKPRADRVAQVLGAILTVCSTGSLSAAASGGSGVKDNS